MSFDFGDIGSGPGDLSTAATPQSSSLDSTYYSDFGVDPFSYSGSNANTGSVGGSSWSDVLNQVTGLSGPTQVVNQNPSQVSTTDSFFSGVGSTLLGLFQQVAPAYAQKITGTSPLANPTQQNLTGTTPGTIGGISPTILLVGAGIVVFLLLRK